MNMSAAGWFLSAAPVITEASRQRLAARLMARNQQTIRLSGGPWNGQVFYVDDWEERRRAAEQMRWAPTAVRGWALGYRSERRGSESGSGPTGSRSLPRGQMPLAPGIGPPAGTCLLS